MLKSTFPIKKEKKKGMNIISNSFTTSHKRIKINRGKWAELAASTF